MDKQIIISISREYGSCGHEVAEKIAKDLGIKLYDRNLLDAIADDRDMNVETLKKYDEKPRNPLLTRTVAGHSNSMEEHLVDMQFEFLQKVADIGESFVIVGRCAETALKGRDGLIRVFILGDKKEKVEHVMTKFNLSETEAIIKMKRHDAKRKAYHNRYSDFKWGDTRGYDLAINSSRLGVEKTAQLIEQYIEIKKQA